MDSEYKRGLLRFEPWKIVFTAFAAGATVVGAIVGVALYLSPPRTTPTYAFPPGTIITIPEKTP